MHNRCQSHPPSNTTTVLAQGVLFIWCFTLMLRRSGVFVVLPTVVVGAILVLITLAVIGHAFYTAWSEVRRGIEDNIDISSAATAATAAAVAAVENAAAAAAAASEVAVGEVKAALEKQLSSLRAALSSRDLSCLSIEEEQRDDSNAAIDQEGIAMVMLNSVVEEVKEREKDQRYWAEEYLCGANFEEKAE